MRANRMIFLAGASIALAALAAYHNSFGVPFIFDDEPSICDNPSIRQLWPLTGPLNPPRSFGFTVSGRPVLNLSLALNYAASRVEPWSYHVFNLVIHIGAGLALFGLVRRTLSLPPGLGRSVANNSAAEAKCFSVSVRLQERAMSVAFVTALLWTLHPLQTESVTYVIQRAESLMGLFYLLTLYCFVRLAEPGGTAKWGWLSFFACLLGMGTKEVMATAPLLVLLYDRIFIAGGCVEALRRRAGFYFGLAATWGLLAVLVASTGGDRGGTFKLSAGAFWSYWSTQVEALARYLGLVVWPHPLIFEYGMATNESPLARAGFASAVGLFVVLVIWMWRHSPRAAYGLIAFLVILAPTSLMPGALQVIVEHRLYLPLAGVLVTLIAGVVAWRGRRGLGFCLVVALVAGVMTERRNRVYQSELSLWSDTVQKRPSSAKAQNNLGRLLLNVGELNPALWHIREAIRLDSTTAQPYFNLGLALQESGRPDEAVVAFAEAVRILPYFAQAHAKLGIVLAKSGRKADAAEHLRIAHSYIPDLPDAHLGLGLLLASDGRDAEAQSGFERALGLDPALAEARLGLGVTLARQGKLSEALQNLQQLVREAPKMAEAYENMGIVQAESGDLAGALVSYDEALRLQPDYAKTHYNLGNAYIRLRRWSEAKAEFERAVQLQPDFEAAQEMLIKFKEQNL